MFQLLQLLLFIIISLNGVLAETSSYCPEATNIRYPFRYQINDGAIVGDDGYPGLLIKCSEYPYRLFINISNHIYHVQRIYYEAKIVTVVDVDIEKEECPLPRRNVSLESIPSLHYYSKQANMNIFYNCTNIGNVEQALPCLENNNNNNNRNTSKRSYAFVRDNIPKGFNWYRNCEESVEVLFDAFYFDVSLNRNITQALKLGFPLSWSAPSDCEDCERSGGQCQYNSTGASRCHCNNGEFRDRICPQTHPGKTTGSKVMIGVSTGVGVLCFILLVIYGRTVSSSLYLVISHWRNGNKSSTNVEVFLENYGCLALQTYKYSDIKKMTNSFKDTLGQGGYGCVFKGKLCDGRLVAVKVLKDSKQNGEEFINEVTTIGRTNHVNVVGLLGFCSEGTKRALVYEFMSNGSLERFIYNENNSSTTPPPLGWEKLYHIALGIARGLEYLHRGCNTCILHFDIKPHNILLDEDFCPKISDFGMAKLCPTREISVVSLVGARGTIGYIAPEVCCRNFGGVSHKSDVYSYGMMVLEMIGGRKNIDAAAENMSEIYFPQWIYNHLKPDFNIEESNGMFEEETTKKMIVVALWCVQTHPTNRPSMSKVVDLLEGNNDDLVMPPNPFLDLSSLFSSSLL